MAWFPSPFKVEIFLRNHVYYIPELAKICYPEIFSLPLVFLTVLRKEKGRYEYPHKEKRRYEVFMCVSF